MDIPLLEFDDERESVHEPAPPKTDAPIPRAVVLCFFTEVLNEWARDERLSQIGSFSPEVGGQGIFLYKGADGSDAVVFHPGMGGPLAAHCLDKVLSAGVDVVVAVGGAASLNPELAQDEVLVVGSAVRDEGTSYHYLPPTRQVTLDTALAELAQMVLSQSGLPHRVGTTWTTDADFRETPRRIARRRDEGCQTVEMEAASLAAVCQFRGVRYAHLLYSADALHGAGWDERAWTASHRRKQLLGIALRLATGQP